MPLHYCHLTSPHKKLRVPEWYVSGLMMERALDAVVRRVKKLDRAHDIPYLAGYSRDGKTIYIDRHMPKSFRFRGRVIETDRFLILHEEVEKTLIDQLHLHYLHAHQIASRAEQAAVRAAAERQPGVGLGTLVEEALGPERVRLWVDLRAPVGQPDARRQHLPCRNRVAVELEVRLHGSADDRDRDWRSSRP